jgi:hypothetical protein
LLEGDEAVRRARDRAVAEGWEPADYEEPVAERQGESWVVRFEGRERRPGNHLVVLVDATTGAAELWPGR